jgi:hypothetical protein
MEQQKLDDIIFSPEIEKILSELETGDIILFQGKKFWFSKLVSWYTGSPYTHVGMVLRDPTYIEPNLKGLYMWESGLENFNDAENNIRKLGIQITDFREMLKNIDGEILYYRKLHSQIPDLENKLAEIHHLVHNRPYDTSLIDLLETTMNVEFKTHYGDPILHLFARNYNKTDTFYCSAFLAFLYTELGLLPKETKWTICSPAFFSDSDPNFKVLYGTIDKNKFLFQQ